MAVEGRLYGINVGGEFVNCEIGCQLSVQRELMNKSNSTNGSARHHRYGYYTWTISMNAKSIISILKGSFNNLLTAQLAGTELDVYIMARVSNIQEINIGGKVLIPSLNMDFPSVGASTFDVTFQGNGVLNVDVEEFGLIINAMPAEADKPLVVNTASW